LSQTSRGTEKKALQACDLSASLGYRIETVSQEIQEKPIASPDLGPSLFAGRGRPTRRFAAAVSGKSLQCFTERSEFGPELLKLLVQGLDINLGRAGQ
jgi:hypothetical protein